MKNRKIEINRDKKKFKFIEEYINLIVVSCI